MEKIKSLSKLCVALLGIFLSIEGVLFACFTYLKMSGEDLSKKSFFFLKAFPVTSTIVGNICGIFVAALVTLCARIFFINRNS